MTRVYRRIPGFEPKRSAIRRALRAERTLDGITFDSKAEMRRYAELKLLRRAGEVTCFERQPPFDLAGVTYHADFRVWWKDGRTTVEDVKGRGWERRRDAREFRRVRKQVKTLYGIEIEVVER